MRQVLTNLLQRLCGFSFTRPRTALSVLLLSFGLSALYGATHIQLRLAWTYLFDAEDPVVRQFEEARELFPFPGDIAILVDQGSEREREDFVQAVAAEMEKEADHYHHVLYRLSLKEIGQRALYFLEKEQLRALGEVLARKRAAKPDNLTSEHAVKLQLKLLEDLKKALLTRGRGPLVPVWEVFDDNSGDPRLDSLFRLLRGEEYIYTTLAGGRVHVLVFKGGTRGSQLASDGSEVERVRALLQRLKPSSYGLRVRLTGLPVMLYDERQTCAQDSIRSGVLSAILITLVFAFGFGGFKRPFFSFLGLLCGLGWTSTYAALTVGHLNFVTVTMVTMLMGLGIDFGIHFLFRFEEEKEKSLDPSVALERTVETTGVDTLVGAMATSASFAALSVTDFRGVSDLGILASGGILLCFFSTVLVLPALLAQFPTEDRPKTLALNVLRDFVAKLLNLYPAILLASILCFGGGAYYLCKAKFNYNLLEVQAQELASVQTEREMLQEYQLTVLGAAVVADSEEQARDFTRRLRRLKSVASVTSLTDLIPAVDEEKKALVERAVALSGELKLPEPVSLERAKDLQRLQAEVEKLEVSTRDLPKDAGVLAAVDEIKSVIADMPPGPIQDGLKSFQDSLRRDFRSLLEILAEQNSRVPSFDDAPESIKIRYLSEDSHFLLSVQPAEDIWQRPNLEAFLAEVDAEGIPLVGHPVVQAHILGSFDRAFKVTPLYTLTGVLLVMFLYLRRPAAVILSSIPTALGVFLIFAVMGACGTDFNVVNFVALPVSVGIGAVYGIHSLHRIQESGHESLLGTSTGHAILLSGLTTIAGFASLMTAHHRGLSSFGFVISVGVFANLIVSLLVLPAFFRWWRKHYSIQ